MERKFYAVNISRCEVLSDCCVLVKPKAGINFQKETLNILNFT